MSSMRHARSKDGTPIAYARTGSGPHLIMIEPAGHYSALSAFDELVPLLSDRFAVVTYDRRGRGRSGDGDGYLAIDEVNDLAAVIAEIGETPFVYGYSSGALVALHAAASKIPIAKMVLLEPPLRDEGDKGSDPLTLELAEMVKAGRSEDVVERFHTSIGVPQELIDEMRGTDRWSKMVAIAPSLVHDCVLSDATTASLLRSVETPTLILDSDGSTDNLTGSAAQAAKQIPGASHRSLAGEWHTVAPSLLATEIQSFCI